MDCGRAFCTFNQRANETDEGFRPLEAKIFFHSSELAEAQRERDPTSKQPQSFFIFRQF